MALRYITKVMYQIIKGFLREGALELYPLPDSDPHN